MILPSNNSPYPLFVTKLKKQLFKTNQISLGHGIHGDEIWVAIKNKKQIERSDKLISGEWLKVSFGISERGRFSVKDKYVYKKDLIEAGISENTILKYKNKLSILLAAHQCFYECEEAIRDSRIYCPDVATFADLFEDSGPQMREFRTKVMEEGASEDVTKLLRERTLHAIYRNLESRGFIPPSLNEESFTTSLDKPDDLEAIDSIRIWQLLSQYLFSALEKDFFASELKTHRVGGRDFIQYLIQDSDRLLEVATDLETVANDNDGIDSAEALKRLLLVAQTPGYEKFFQIQKDIMEGTGIESASDFIKLFKHPSSITLERLKSVSFDESELTKLLTNLNLINIHHELKQGNITGLSQKTFVNLALESGIAGKKWKQISVYLSQMMNNGEIIEFLRRYNVSTDDFIMCLTHHSNQLPSVLVELERVVNSGGQQEEELVLNLEALRQRMDHVASFKGLRQFYVQYTKKQAKQTHWGSLREFLEYMESSDMTLKKLTNLQEKGKLESFFRSIKTDLADFIKLKELFPESAISFPRYLTYLTTSPKILGLPLGFRNLIKASIRAESSSLLRTYLSTAEKNWLETEYKKYESSSAIESLFDETLGAGKRWVQDPQTGKRTQVVDNQPLTPTHFVEIVTYARNEIEKGNTQEITRLFKETTRLLRTVIVNPMNSRVHILLKGKGVLNPRSAGTFKSVTQRVVIEPDNKAKIYADINIKLPLDWAGTIEEWREGIRDEFAHSDAVLDVEEHRSPKSGRIAISAAQEWLTIPDLRAQNIRKLTTKQRLKILIGVLRNLREKHAGNEFEGGIVHGDLKPDNMGATQEKDGLQGKVTDMGTAKKMGIITQKLEGSPAYYSPQVARELLAGKGHRLLPQRDLWAFGLSLYEVLCTETEAEPNSRAHPDFYIKLYNETVAQLKANNQAENLMSFLRVILPKIRDLTQEEVNESIDDMELEGPGCDELPDAAWSLLKDIVKSLLQVDDQTVEKSDAECLKDALELEDNVIAALESIFELPDNEEIGQKDKDIREIERIENDSEVTSSVEIDDENLEI